MSSYGTLRWVKTTKFLTETGIELNANGFPVLDESFT
jgi:hypothetical protein